MSDRRGSKANGARVRKAMVLAAGEGQRLRPLTLDRPKPMLPVGGRPVLAHTLTWLRYHGISDVAINLCYMPEAVTSELGDGSSLGVRIRYSLEPAPLGTAGGTRRLAAFLDEPFVLVYGDVLTDLDLTALIAYHQAQPPGAHLTMCLYHVPNPQECGIVELDATGRVRRFIEKPAEGEAFSDLANAGVLVVDPDILACIQDGEAADIGRDLVPRLLEAGIPTYGWLLPDEAYLIDIGTPEKYARVQSDWPTPAARAYLTRDAAAFALDDSAAGSEEPR